jgi:hypothetical protein
MRTVLAATCPNRQCDGYNTGRTELGLYKWAAIAAMGNAVLRPG